MSKNKIEIKKGKEIIFENWSELTTDSQAYDDNVEFYKSTIIWGSQYDAMLSWMQNNKINVFFKKNGGIAGTHSGHNRCHGLTFFKYMCQSRNCR